MRNVFTPEKQSNELEEAMAMLLRQRAVARTGLAMARGQLGGNARCCFSSSAGDGDTPQFERGMDFAYGMWQRSTERLPKFEEYQQNGVFSQSLGGLRRMLLFVQLQMPRKTEVDAVDFLEGAKVAVEANLRAVNSAAFREYLVDGENSSPEVAERLQQYCTPAYYNMLALSVKQNFLKRGVAIECEDMRVETAHLASAQYTRLTEQEYEDEVTIKKAPGAINPKATLERLHLCADVATVEDLKLIHGDREIRYVQQQNLYGVVFESRVTTPDEVDWRIMNMRLVKKTAIERKPETSTAAADEKKNE